MSENTPNSGFRLPQLTLDWTARKASGTEHRILVRACAFGLPSFPSNTKEEPGMACPGSLHFTWLYLQGVWNSTWQGPDIQGEFETTYRDKISKDAGTGSQMTCVSIPKGETICKPSQGVRTLTRIFPREYSLRSGPSRRFPLHSQWP